MQAAGQNHSQSPKKIQETRKKYDTQQSRVVTKHEVQKRAHGQIIIVQVQERERGSIEKKEKMNALLPQ